MSQEERRDQDEFMESEDFMDQDEAQQGDQSERFYDGEVDDTRIEEDVPGKEQSETSAPEEEEDDLQYFLKMISGLRKMIERGTPLPFSSKRIIDARRFLEIIDAMEDNLPQAVEYGMRVYDECDRILGSAQQQAAEIISSAEMQSTKSKEKVQKYTHDLVTNAEKDSKAKIDDAEQQAQMLISESEIVRKAREEAQRIRNDAENEVREYRLKVRHEMLRQLGQSQRSLVESAKAIEKVRKAVDKSGEEDDY